MGYVVTCPNLPHSTFFRTEQHNSKANFQTSQHFLNIQITHVNLQHITTKSESFTNILRLKHYCNTMIFKFALYLYAECTQCSFSFVVALRDEPHM